MSWVLAVQLIVYFMANEFSESIVQVNVCLHSGGGCLFKADARNWIFMSLMLLVVINRDSRVLVQGLHLMLSIFGA